MRFMLVGFGIFLLQCTLCMGEGKENNICYQAKICIHNGKEKCGITKDGTPRRFFDSCDIKEYNCLKNADFVKTDINKCSKLPPIEGGVDKSSRRTKFENGKFENVRRKLMAP